jgi:hypothetical protein
MAVVRVAYPDKASVPRTFGADGLEAELGGPGAWRVSICRDAIDATLADLRKHRPARMARTSGEQENDMYIPNETPKLHYGLCNYFIEAMRTKEGEPA